MCPNEIWANDDDDVDDDDVDDDDGINYDLSPCRTIGDDLNGF